MSFLDERLSDCVTYGFSGGPEWSTVIVSMDNGREQRNGQWLYPRHRYNAPYMNFDREAQQELLAAFHVMRGQLHACRFRDWNDYQSENEALAPAIGTSTPVQLVKTYSFGGQSTARLIQAPVAGAVVSRNGVPVAGTLDANTGLFTPSAPWVAGTFTWSGEFDVWVRFASDFNAFTIGNLDAHTADVELVEVRR